MFRDVRVGADIFEAVDVGEVPWGWIFFEKSPPNINGFSGALNVGLYCNVH